MPELVDDFIVFERVLDGETYSVIAEDIELSVTRVNQKFRKAARRLWHEVNDGGPLLSRHITPSKFRNDADFWRTALAEYRLKLIHTLDEPRFVEAKALLHLANSYQHEYEKLQKQAARDVFFAVIDGTSLTVVARLLGVPVYVAKRLLALSVADLTGSVVEPLHIWYVMDQRTILLELANEKGWAREYERPESVLDSLSENEQAMLALDESVL